MIALKPRCLTKSTRQTSFLGRFYIITYHSLRPAKTPALFPLTPSLTPTFPFFKTKNNLYPFIAHCFKSLKLHALALHYQRWTYFFALPGLTSQSIQFFSSYFLWQKQNPELIAFVGFIRHFTAVKAHCCRHDPIWLSGTRILALFSLLASLFLSLFFFF